MPTNYAQHTTTKQTPQTQPIPNKTMVENSAGGYTFQLDNWKRLERFLILGCDGGTYYATEKKLTIENAKCINECLKIDGYKTIDTIVTISDSGRAPKNDPAIYALAICAAYTGTENSKIRAYALEQLPKVCRIGTHLFQFIEAIRTMRGFGPTLKKGIANWYTTHKDLPYQVIKYQQRNGMAHRDVLRLCHAPNNTPIYRWVTGANQDKREVTRKTGTTKTTTTYQATEGELPPIIQAFEEAKKTDNIITIKTLIETHNLPRECIPTKWLKDPSVWESLLIKMPMTAMIRNLATMTKNGLIAPMSNATGKIIIELTNNEKLQKSRIHPITILSALMTYQKGHSERGDSQWKPASQICDALDGAFYRAFGNIQPTGKKHLIACDVSQSMETGNIAGIQSITPRIATAALALITAATEPQHHIIAFTSNGKHKVPSMHPQFPSGISPLTISPRQRLDDVIKTMKALPLGGTDCALPMIYAMKDQIPTDVFIILTDCETWAGNIHPIQALEQYNKTMQRQAKLIVIGMTATEFTIADPNNPNMLDVIGFDTATPTLISDFVKN